MNRWIAVGQVLRAHGLHGDVVIRRFGESADVLAAESELRLGEGARAITVKVLGAKPHGRDWIVTLEGIGGRDEAEALRGSELFVPQAKLPELPQGAYYRFQLVGLRVRTPEGVELGRIEEILETGANDVCVVRGDRGEILIPAVDALVAKVDVPGGEMIVTPIPGLVPGLDDEAEGAKAVPSPREKGE